MKRLLLALIAIAAITIGVSLTTNQSEAQGRPGFSLPPQAREVAPNVFLLGTAVVDGQVLSGYAFLHPAPNAARPPGAGGGRGGGGASCFAFLASGAKWKVTEPYLFDPANLAGLDPSALPASLGTSLAQWDNQVAFAIFGSGSTATGLTADAAAPDGTNEVLFGPIDSPGTIAVTIVWGVFSGPPFGRYLAEWDMVFDDVDFGWSNGVTGVAGKMDFTNIATHEDGHAAGMAHPEDSCTDETMYRFADYGETKKRDLNPGDIAGIQRLYG